MSDAAVAAPAPTAPAPATPVKKTKAAKPKGEKKAKATPSHPVYGAMIKAAIKELKDRKGASKQAILKYITQKYKVGDNEKQINARLRLALKKGVENGLLKQASGTGAAGRFRLAEKTESPAKPKVAKKPKPAGEAKPKKAAAAKPKVGLLLLRRCSQGEEGEVRQVSEEGVEAEGQVREISEEGRHAEESRGQAQDGEETSREEGCCPCEGLNPAAKPKGEKKAKATPSHPVYGAMIKAAIKELKDRKGASKQAILKYITQKYKVGDNEKQVGRKLCVDFG
ncbi:linker histone H1 and H5 family protein, partial [Oesophagostomum dentatum]